MIRTLLIVVLGSYSYVGLAQWNVSGSNIYNTNSGNVGVGITSPTFKLHVKGNIVAEGDGGANYADLNLKNGSVRWHISGPRSDNNNRLGIFWHNGTSYADLFTFTTDGKLGIGTNSPNSNLHITAVNSSTRLLIENTQSTSSTYPGIWIKNYQGTTAGHPYITMSNGRGTASTPSSIQDGGLLGCLIFSGHNGSDFMQAARIEVFATSTFTSTSTPTLMKFSTTRPGATLYDEKMRISPEGNVGIGTTSPDAKLTVKGTIHSQEVKVDLNVPGPDYVFEEDYKLPSLAEVGTYIEKNKHLPEVPSAKEMEENGINLSEMNMILLKKVEELTLYVIELKKENSKIVELEMAIEKLSREIKSK